MYIDIILLIIAICYPFIFKYIEQYFSQKGKNAAQKEDVRDIQYESKKGENIATKEDIKEITSQIETVKNEISFEKQRRHEFINQRTERLLKILYLTEKLNEQQGILLYALYDKHSSKRLLSLIEQINGTLLSFLHECRIIYVTVEDNDLTSRVTDLIKDAQAYAGYMCYIASNAASHLTNWEDFLDLAEKHNNATQLLNEAIKSQNGVEQTRKEFENNISDKKEALYESQIKYLSKLNLLFGSEFHLKE